MNNQNKKISKKIFAITLTAILSLNILPDEVAMALVLKGKEKDIIATDIDTPSCASSNNQSSSDVGTSDNRFYAFVWEDDICDGGGNGSGIYLERYDLADGPNPSAGPESIPTTLTGDQKNPSIAMDNEGNYVVAWEGNGSGDSYGIFVRAFDRDGTPRGPEHLVNTYTTGVQDSPKIAIDFDRNPVLGNEQHFVVAWHGEGTEDNDGIYIQGFDILAGGDISAIGSNISVNSYTTGDQTEPDVAITNLDEVVVTWSGPGTGYPSTSEIWMQGYNVSAVPWFGINTNTKINSTSPANKPAIAVNKSTEGGSATVPGGAGVVIYRGGVDNQIYGRMFDRCSSSPCALNNVELNINNVTSDNPDVAMDYLGNFTIVWDQDDGSGADNVNIHGINYDHLGHRIDTNFRINEDVYSDAAANQTNPAVAKDKDGEYFITWTSPNLGNDIRYRSYGTDVFKNGPAVLATADTAAYEEQIASAISPDGTKVMVNVHLDGSLLNRIYFTLISPNGTVIAQDQLADTIADGSVDSPSVSFFKDTTGPGLNRFVIVWLGGDPGGQPGQNVMYREFDGSGTATDPEEMLINGTFNTSHFDPKVSAGYYQDASTNVIDRFAISYIENNASNTQAEVIGAYHDETGTTENIIEPMSVDCHDHCAATNTDMYPDINGNDKIVYVWSAKSSSRAVYGQEANEAVLSGSPFLINNTTSVDNDEPDVAFVAPNQYVIAWEKCDVALCDTMSIYGSRYTGDFSSGTPTVTDDDFVVFPSSALEISTTIAPKIAGDPSTGAFIVIWSETIWETGLMNSIESIYGKFFETASGLKNFGVGFNVNTASSVYTADVDMNNQGQVIVGWDGVFETTPHAQIFQILNNPLYIQTLPELPTSAQLTIAPGGKTLTIPSTIQFPSVTASTMNNTDVEREIDENPAPGQPLFFQLEDLGGNSPSCSPGPCYSVTVSSTDFTYTDPSTSEVYTIPASNVFLKNYDGNHAGVVNTGTCGSPEANLSFDILFGNSADFALDGTSCDYVSLDTNQTLINKTSNTSDTAKVKLYPKIKITVPALTPPGTYTGTITITSA